MKPAARSSLLVWFAVTGLASAQVSPCMFDADGDGHPIFGTPSARVDLEYLNGVIASARVSSGCFADFNGDGKIDFAAAHFLGISVLPGSGDGVFGNVTMHQFGTRTTDIRIADLDGDGWPDLAATNLLTNSVSVLMNNGDGTFRAPVNYLVGSGPRSLKAADLNGDGMPDLAVLNPPSGDVSVLINLGDGTFAPQQRYATGGVSSNLGIVDTGPFLDVGDLNGDGHPDIAVPAGPWIRLLLNDGKGVFTLATEHPTVVSMSAYTVVITDVDGDGHMDLAASVTAGGDRAVSVVRNRGGAQFDPPVSYRADPTPFPGAFAAVTHLAAGDLDGDGLPELAVGFFTAWESIPLLRNRGDGTFAPQELIQADDDSWWVALEDIRGKGVCDLPFIGTSSFRSTLRTRLNDGKGNLITEELTPASRLENGNEMRFAVAAADFDGNGTLDLAIGSRAPGPAQQLRIVRNAGGGVFVEDGPRLVLGPHNQSEVYTLATGDLDGDGLPEIVVADSINGGGWTEPGRVWVVPNTGGLTFGTPVAYPVGDATPRTVSLSDVNRDGHPDVVVWTCQVHPGNDEDPVDRRIEVLLNDGSGGLVPGGTYIFDAMPWLPSGGAECADMNGDGWPDIVATASTREGGAVSVLLNRGDGTFDIAQRLPTSIPCLCIASGDFNGDGFPDVVVGRALHRMDAPYIEVLINDGQGRLSPLGVYEDHRMRGGLFPVVADLDGDGVLDLALPKHESRGVAVLLGVGDGTFGPMVEYGAFGYGDTQRLAAADFDGDGRTDIVAINAAGAYLSFLRNRGCGCYANCDGSTAAPVLNVSDFVCFQQRFAAGDLRANCDGSTAQPVLNVNDFVCFQQRFAGGCP